MTKYHHKMLGMIMVTALLLVFGGSVSAVEDLSGVTITVSRWAGDPFESSTLELARQFEEMTGARVIVDSVPWENLREIQALELASGSGEYDVLYIHPSWYIEFVEAGYLLDLEALLDDAVLDTFIPSLLDTSRVDGVLYGLPDFIATILLAYRTDLFADAGLEPPQDWADVLEKADTLASNGFYGLTIPARRGGTLADVFGTLLPGPGGWYWDEQGEPAIGSSAAIETAEFVIDMMKASPPGVLNFHWDEAGNAAMQNRTAMMAALSVNASWLDDPERSATAGLWEFVPFKYQGNPSGLVMSYSWSVAKDSQEPEAAAMFIDWLTQTEQQNYLALTTGTAGARADFYTQEALLEDMPFLKAMEEAFVNAKPQPAWSGWPILQDQLELGLHDVFMGNETVENLMESLQELMQGQR